MHKGVLVILFYLINLSCFSHDNPYNNSFQSATDGNYLPFWKLTDIKGLVYFRGVSRRLDIFRGDFSENQRNLSLGGGLSLNTRSYLWHPNFLQIEIDGEYNPESNKDNYIVLPDRSEQSSLSRFEVRGVFFNTKPISLTTFYNIGESYSNRENLNNLVIKTKSWGGSYFYNNRLLNHKIRFIKSNSNKDEINSERDYVFDKTSFEFNANKSLTKNNDQNEFLYQYNDYATTQWGNTAQTKTNVFTLNNRYYLNSSKKGAIGSSIVKSEQKGVFFNMIRFKVDEMLVYTLPKNFELSATYCYNDENMNLQRTKLNRVKGMVTNQLYLSLKSGIFYEYNTINRIYSKERISKLGSYIHYTKKIYPIKGRINIDYSYERHHNSAESNDNQIYVINEEYILTDGVITILNRAYIQQSSVIVTDVGGSMIFQQGLDYILVTHNNYLEIQRIPGGLIQNNTTIYVSYIATIPGTYSFSANIHSFNIRLSLLKNLFEIYYRRRDLQYRNLYMTDNLTLNYYSQNIVGARINYLSGSAGIDWDNCISTVLPYQMIHYYLDVSYSVNDRINVNGSANISKYKFLEIDNNSSFYDAQGRFSYRVFTQTNLTISTSYVKQDYNGIMLDLILAGAEVSTTHRKLNFTIRFDFYHRKYLVDETKLRGVYIQLTRKF